MPANPSRPPTADPAPQPANRAERRAAKRGRPADDTGTGPATPRNTGPAPHAKPARIRADFAARRTG